MFPEVQRGYELVNRYRRGTICFQSDGGLVTENTELTAQYISHPVLIRGSVYRFSNGSLCTFQVVDILLPFIRCTLFYPL